MTANFPELPILTPEQVRRTESERYGILFYLGIGGLITLLALLGWFGASLWQTRALWRNVYRINDPRLPEPERIAAAEALARDPGVTQGQLWDLSLSRVPPDRARYVLAEALDAEAISGDPSAYALSVARSEGWPDWLRLLLIRPMAYDHGRYGLPREPLAELRRHPDPGIALWAAYIQAVARDDPEAAAWLDAQAQGATPMAPLARLLARALDETDPARRRDWLDQATVWLRQNHPAAVALWATAPR